MFGDRNAPDQRDIPEPPLIYGLPPSATQRSRPFGSGFTP